jgi:hypothetical protein
VLRIWDVYPGSWILIFYPSRIPDPKTATKERGEKKFIVIPFFVAANFTKFEVIYFYTVEEQNLGQFSKNCRTFYPKNCHLSKIWFWDPGKTYPGSHGSQTRVQKSIGSRIWISNTALKLT